MVINTHKRIFSLVTFNYSSNALEQVVTRKIKIAVQTLNKSSITVLY